jgi:seryl-tRNA synthetase
MPEFRAGTTKQISFLDELVEARLLARTGVHGVYARGREFDDVRLAFDALVTRAAAAEDPEPLAHPPVFPRAELERNDYLASFPHLAGSVFGFEGDEQDAASQLALAEHHEDWSGFQTMTDLVLLPAACYPLYPQVAARGPLPEGGLTLDTRDSYVFRREPSSDPARMQSFHMREIVKVADKETVLDWREEWRGRAAELLRALGLEIELDVANDPFFGRAGRMLASQQRDQQLKWELMAPVAEGSQTAIASSNYHQDHFGLAYDIRTADDQVAHTGCMAFGEERVTLTLFAAHGLDIRLWPSAVRDQLNL